MSVINSFIAQLKLSAQPEAGATEQISNITDTQVFLRTVGNVPNDITGVTFYVSSAVPSNATISINDSIPLPLGSSIGFGYAPGNATALEDLISGLVTNPSLVASAGSIITVDVTYYARDMSPATGGPTLSLASASVEDANPDQIVLTFSSALDGASVPATTDFTVSGGKTVNNVAIAGSVITLTVDSAYTGSDSITISYAPGVNPVTAQNGATLGTVANQGVINNSTVDNTAPTATLSGAIPANTTVGSTFQIVVVFADTVSLDLTTITASSISVTDGQNNATVAIASNTGDTLSRTVTFDITPTVVGSYTVSVPTDGFRDAAGNQVAATVLGSTIAGSATPSLQDLFPVGATVVYSDAGQSNANGWQGGPGATLFSHTFSSRVQTYYKADQLSINDDAAFQTFELGVNTNREGSSFPDPSIWVAKRLEDETTNDIRVIQCAQGSTGFNSGTGLWGPGNGLANALENHFLKPGLAELQNQGRTVYLLPLLFVQHEADLQNVTHAPNYEAQLTTFIANLRSYIGIADYPVVLVQILSATTLGNVTTRAQILSAQQTIANNDANVRLINADSFSVASDSVHFLDEGYRQLADAYITECLSLGARVWSDPLVNVSLSPAVENIQQTSIDVRAGSSEFTTFYASIYADGTANPGAAAIKAGTGAIDSASVALSYTSATSAVTLTGLTSGTDYEVFTVIEDKAGNQSVSAIAATTSSSVATTEFLDTFSGSLALDDAAYVLDTDTSGQGWTVDASGNVVASSGQAARVGNANGFFYTTKNDWSGPIVEVSANITLAGAVTGLMFRYAGPANRLGVFLIANNQANTIRLFENNNIVLETYAYSGAALNSSTPYPLLIQFTDSEIRVQFEGEVFVTSNSQSSGNSCGGWLRNTTGRYDNFQVRSLPAFTI